MCIRCMETLLCLLALPPRLLSTASLSLSLLLCHVRYKLCCSLTLYTPFPRQLPDVLSVNVRIVSDVKEYITVSQLSHIFGMQGLAPSSSSSIPSFQLTSSETNFLCHSAPRGPSSLLSAQVGCICLYYHILLTHLFPKQPSAFDSFYLCAWRCDHRHCCSCLLLLDASPHLRVSPSCAGMHCLLLTWSAGTRTSWLQESLSHVLRRYLQSLFPLAGRCR